jgi:hypothetical protein
LQEKSYEDPTVCPVVVQVRGFGPVSGKVFQPAARAPLVIANFDGAAAAASNSAIPRC